MKKYAVICSLLLGISSGCGQKKAVAPRLEDITQKSGNCYSCTFDGVKHGFIIDLPEHTDNAPLVLMLHGYGSSAEDFRTSVQFEKDATPLGYAVVYVTGAPDPNDATSSTGWNSVSDPKGNKDTEFLVSLAEYLQEEYSLNKTKTYAVGFSNGAFMTHTLAMDASGTFSALVSVSGMMQADIWDRRKSSSNVSFFQITGEKDDVVPKNSDGSAKFAKAPPIEDVMSYWAESDGAELTEKINIGKATVLTRYVNTDTHAQVWDLLVKDGGHSWFTEKLNGFDTNELILEFFESLD
jgi:poly(3-hydroxybutyrate) depolymerase